MAYNNAPMGYPYYYTQPAPQAQSQQNGIIWVQGETGAKSYLVAPNNTVQLWDSESQTIYLKSADASGMPSVKVLDYTIRETNRNTPVSVSSSMDGQSATYATKDEIKDILAQIASLRDRVDSLMKRRSRDDD